MNLKKYILPFSLLMLVSLSGYARSLLRQNNERNGF